MAVGSVNNFGAPANFACHSAPLPFPESTGWQDGPQLPRLIDSCYRSALRPGPRRQGASPPMLVRTIDKEQHRITFDLRMITYSSTCNPSK
jgi:hypothetical protein